MLLLGLSPTPSWAAWGRWWRISRPGWVTWAAGVQFNRHLVFWVWMWDKYGTTSGLGDNKFRQVSKFQTWLGTGSVTDSGTKRMSIELLPWNLVSSSLMAAMMGAVSPSVVVYGSRVAKKTLFSNQGCHNHDLKGTFSRLGTYFCLPFLAVHVWIRDLWRLGYPDLLLGAGALRPAALLLLLLQLYIKILFSIFCHALRTTNTKPQLLAWFCSSSSDVDPGRSWPRWRVFLPAMRPFGQINSYVN